MRESVCVCRREAQESTGSNHHNSITASHMLARADVPLGVWRKPQVDGDVEERVVVAVAGGNGLHLVVPRVCNARAHAGGGDRSG